MTYALESQLTVSLNLLAGRGLISPTLKDDIFNCFLQIRTLYQKNVEGVQRDAARLTTEIGSLTGTFEMEEGFEQKLMCFRSDLEMTVLKYAKPSLSPAPRRVTRAVTIEKICSKLMRYVRHAQLYQSVLTHRDTKHIGCWLVEDLGSAIQAEILADRMLYKVKLYARNAQLALPSILAQSRVEAHTKLPEIYRVRLMELRKPMPLFPKQWLASQENLSDLR